MLRAAHRSTTTLGIALRGQSGWVSGPGQRRYLSIHEYLAVDLLNKYGVATPTSKAAHSAQEAKQVAEHFAQKGVKNLVIKAQVLAGGRGKGHFENGFQGGVHMVNSPQEAEEMAGKMLGNKLITKQTGERGRPCNTVMLAEARPPKKEYYLAVLMDRTSGGPAIVASSQGGMSIEEVAKEDPSAIKTLPISLEKGLQDEDARKLATELGFKDKAVDEAVQIMLGLYKLFIEKDATQIEINPLAQTEDGHVLCMDAKLGFDDNAKFRQEDIFKLRDKSQEDATEVAADEFGLNYIKLDGSIGCLVNGAGLAMATLDTLVVNGGTANNFLDVGGGATADAVTEAFGLIRQDKKVKAILVNIFGGIMRCDVIAEGVIEATKRLSLDIPLVVRLQGTKVKEAQDMIKNSGLSIHAIDNLDLAAKTVVELARKGGA